MTEFQSALDEGLEALEELDPQTVQLSVAPGVNVRANIGQFRRQRSQEATGYQWIEFGQIIIRRAALLAAGITTEPDSGQQIKANGKTYKIKFIAPDTTSFALDCVNLS